MYRRLLDLPPSGKESFSLWGPRQTGKTTLLKERYPDGLWLDLLKSDEYVHYSTHPERLRQEIEAEGINPNRQIIIDEVQRVPALLNEVHWLIENYRLHFALCGSSARKVRKQGTNLLGGRAYRYSLQGITAGELGDDFDLDRLLNHGYLPRAYDSDQPDRVLDAYIADYLQQEIAAEGLVRRLPAFAEFLFAASFSDGDNVNYTNIAQDCGVTQTTVTEYFKILEETLVARWLPALRKQTKRRTIKSPKFYFVDCGVVNRLARRGNVIAGSQDYGKAFENWVFHELVSYINYRNSDARLAYWKSSGGIEVDFVLDDMSLAIEAKSSAKISTRHLKGLRAMKKAFDCNFFNDPGQRVLVCRERRSWMTNDGILVLPAKRFVERLWAGELFK